ncbi:MAG TPA: hypothetical protein VGA68_11625, partial [Woeseiaceae bacterium]
MKSKSNLGPSKNVLTQPVDPAHADILAEDALEFIGALANAFATRVDDLLARRTERQKAISNGAMP